MKAMTADTGTPRTAATFPPPVMEARRWLQGVTFPPERPLLNLSQAAPAAAPPDALRLAMADSVLHDPAAHVYGPTLGLPELRAELATRTAATYGGTVTADQVAITAGANQAYAAAIATLCGEGDEVILPVPWYFNHRMWNDMAGVITRPLPCGPDLIPDPEAARAALTPRSRAVVLVSPNNPAGVDYPPRVIAAFRDLARESGIALILDETYRDFHPARGAPHDLFTDPDWDGVLVHLYSFSKAYRLTGHRTGAMVTSAARLGEAEKFLDTTTICAPQIGQRAALWGMRNLDQWLAGERDETLLRGQAVRDGFAGLAARGWRLVSSGAYFAWVEHPFAAPSSEVAQRLLADAGVLVLPGTMFAPEDDPAAARALRVAYANADSAGIEELILRLAEFSM